MEEHKVFQGILAHVDVVNYTSQALKLGDVNAAQYIEYFQERIEALALKQKFQVIKHLGDAVLIFGQSPQGILDIMLDLFQRDKPEDRNGFISKFRISAHSGFFQFKMRNNLPFDMVSAEGIYVFRIEKNAQGDQMIFSPQLYQGIQAFLKEKEVELHKIKLEQPLKGFDEETGFSLLYILTINKRKSEAPNLLKKRIEELYSSTETIQVFSNLFPSVPMEQNFIHLSVHCTDRWDLKMRGIAPDIAEGARAKKPVNKVIQPDTDEMENLSKTPRSNNIQEIDVDALFTNIEKYPQGIFLGLPGAGKTTILRYFTHKELKANQQRKLDEEHIVLFIPCCHIPRYETWCRQYPGFESAKKDEYTLLHLLTQSFLFGGLSDKVLIQDEWTELRCAARDVIKAYEKGRLTILLDALDEVPDVKVKEEIVESIKLLIGGNRIFMTSRPSEYIYLKELKIPFFTILSLTASQMRALAKHVLGEDQETYNRFDTVIWEEEVVLKIAATPLMALLVTVYFQAHNKLDCRYPMYDLLIKFALLNIWGKIKNNTYPYKNLNLLFKTIKETEFSEKNKEIDEMYQALASLCFRLIYDGAGGIIQQAVTEETLLRHFTEWLQNNNKNNPENISQEVQHWVNHFKIENLLLPAEPGEYVFVHFTVMEFLAAVHIVRQIKKEPSCLPNILHTTLKKKNFLQLETIPIATGYNREVGLRILEILKEMDHQKCDSESLHEIGFRCMAEMEWQFTKELQSLNFESDREKELNQFKSKHHAVAWVYLFLQNQIMQTDKKKLDDLIHVSTPFLKLRLDTLLREYLDYKQFNLGDSELVEKRKQLLFGWVQKEKARQWLEEKGKGNEIEYNQVLLLETGSYHREDKNSSYFRTIFGKELQGFFGSPNFKHAAPVRACCFSPDGKTILSASEDHTLKLWNAENGKELRTFTGHSGSVYHCVFFPHGKQFLSASEDHTLKLWDISSGKEIRTFKGHINSVWSCAVAPDCTMIISGSSDTSLILWDVLSGKIIRTFMGHHGAVRSCAISPKGLTVLSASADKTMILWDIHNGQKLQTFFGHLGLVSACGYSPDGKNVVSASFDGSVKIWDVQTGKQINTVNAHYDWVNSCTYTKDGKAILTASADKKIKLWDSRSGEEIRTFAGHTQEVCNAAISPDDIRIISASSDHTLKMWDMKTGQPVLSFNGHSGSVNRCSISSNGDLLASVSQDNTIKIWNVANGKELRTLEGHKKQVLDCVFAPDNKTLVTASDDATLKLWSLENYKEIREFARHKDSITTCAISLDGKILVSGSMDKTITIWDMERGDELCTFPQKEAVLSLSISPDGAKVIVGLADSTISCLDVTTRKEFKICHENQGVINVCTFSPDGRKVLFAMNNFSLKLWDIKNGGKIRTMPGHTDEVSCFTFSQNGKVILSASIDKTLKLWNAESGKLLKSLTLPWQASYIVVSQAHPEIVVTANHNGTLTMFAFDELITKSTLITTEKIS